MSATLYYKNCRKKFETFFTLRKNVKLYLLIIKKGLTPFFFIVYFIFKTGILRTIHIIKL